MIKLIHFFSLLGIQNNYKSLIYVIGCIFRLYAFNIPTEVFKFRTTKISTNSHYSLHI